MGEPGGGFKRAWPAAGRATGAEAEAADRRETGGISAVNALGLTFPERGLALTVRVLLALVLLLPLVSLPDAYYSLVVGKALYARGLIAVAFAAWAVLALERPAWRPPRSALLALLGLWAAAGVLSAVFGVSPQRSVWSHYLRMQGLFDMAHWVAFAVVAASMLKTPRDWRAMLLVGQGVGLAVAAHAVAGVHVPEWIGSEALRRDPRVAGLMGNPGFLGAYLQAVALLAAGFLWRACARPAPAPAPARSRWPARAYHGLTLAATLWALALTGSMGAAVGLVAGVAFGALSLALAVRARRARVAGLAAVCVFGFAAAGTGGALVWRVVEEPQAEPLFDIALLSRLTGAYHLPTAAGARFDNWRGGLAAFAERPVLGWGPDNYIAASGKHLAANSGRFLPGKGAANMGRDHAHNMIVEEAATKGAVGLAAYLVLWGWTLVAVVRAARRADPAERALVAGVGAALFGWFVQSQTWFYFPAAWLVHMLLLAFLARREAAPGGTPPGGDEAMRPGHGIAWPRVAAGTVAVALAVGSLVANAAAYRGAAALHRATIGGPGSFMVELEASIRAFEPMATHPRILLFENVADNWPVLRARYPREAFRLLAWAGRAAPKALAAEPHNWQLHHALAHLYREVTKTEPGYAVLAESFHASSLDVAPNLDPTLPLWEGR